MLDSEQLVKKAAVYADVFLQHDDEERFEKTALFAEKLLKQEFTIGFAGHFSAGKSSMINALTGGDLLPSSPIPTSANIVKVKKTDKDYAIIHDTDGGAVQFDGHGFPNALKSFSKDGASVSLIEIGHTASNLPEGITVMDTPGVDSTDDAHRLSTESALHLADIVFYTMDYNHVQSEMNFRFTKELMRYNDNVYLIINQIDKHRDSELTFEQFQQSVQQSFEMWGVYPKDIFYTSLRNLDLPYNDFPKVKAIVDNSMENWQDQLENNAGRTLEKLKDEHLLFLQEEVEERKNNYAALVSEEDWQRQADLQQESTELKQQLSRLSNDGFARAFEKDRDSLIKGAAITPYETRELLREYMESLSSRFKVGFLFGAKKTAEERERRKEALAANLNELVHTNISVHLKTVMKKSLQQAGILTDDRSLAIDEMDLTIPFDELEKDLSGAEIVTGDAVLNFAERLKSAVHVAFHRLTEPWKNEMAVIASEEGDEKSGMLEQKNRALDEKLAAMEQIEEVVQQAKQLDMQIDQPAKQTKENSAALLNKWKQPKEIQLLTEEDMQRAEAQVPETVEEQQQEISPQSNSDTADTDKAIRQAQLIADAVESVPSFEEMSRYLHRKADRLEGQQFTVALFGAFSAGKSSFSNALMGERVLPVSPNPTTAAINRIKPVEEGKLHNTADVLLKTEQRMTEDVLRSFEAVGVFVVNLEEAFAKSAEAQAIELKDETLHVHKSFIHAFQIGYPEYRKSLGEVLTVDREEFTKFVAEESRSCFVESIDFYFDCELTRKGITLVDTPGADSINARHTDVAFEYIRNADAILFVTYYNHAFARADREFLIQLGRVKDAFELDKMFFIVNAIDLANNDEEAEDVKSFVAGELQKFGIRHPRVHGISSLQALEAKLHDTKNEFMDTFEESFYHFLETDLKGLAVQALQEETVKTVERLASLIERTEKNQLRKAERLEELDRLEGEIRQHFANNFAQVWRKAAHNELGELIYYIVQRVFLRFPDFFKESYNPSTFSNYSTDRALKQALTELVGMVGFDLSQELKVTNLRMLNFMKKQLEDRQRRELAALKEKDASFAPAPYEAQDANMLSFGTPFPDPMVYSNVNKLFKNAKAFFEKGDRDIVKDRLEEAVKKDAIIYFDSEKAKLAEWADQWIESEAEGLRLHLLKQSIKQIASERNILQTAEELDKWRAIYDKIQLKELV